LTTVEIAFILLCFERTDTLENSEKRGISEEISREIPKQTLNGNCGRNLQTRK